MKFLFFSWFWGGHLYSMIGLAQKLYRNGHDIIFATIQQNEHIYTKLGFQTILLDTSSENRIRLRHDLIFPTNQMIFSDKLLDKILNYLYCSYYNTIKVEDNALSPKISQQLEIIIKKIDPNVICIDDPCVVYKSVIESNKPWVQFWCSNPTQSPHRKSILPDDSQDNSNQFIVQTYWTKREQDFEQFHRYLFGETGYDFKFKSPYLNFYISPIEISNDYIESGNKPTFYLDSTVDPDTIPELNFDIKSTMLKNRDNVGLILVAFGTTLCEDHLFMRRIVSMLSKSKHSFIVSKGKNHLYYKLSRNMIGNKHINQKQLLSVVDLVINHGGNNTLTECLYFGKPQIVIPLMYDQPSNANRVRKHNLGIAIEPRHLNEKILLDSIDKLLNKKTNKQIMHTLKSLSNRIQSENKLAKAASLMEGLKKSE